ncbi:MAG: hypothetical protein AABY53_09265 [Bdellovibrionota bacterium]|mgnify:CR=1 FL=1
MKKFILALIFSGTLISLTLNAATSSTERTDIRATIPFIRGADLCKYKDAYGQTRTEYMTKMISMASDLMKAGAEGQEALALLESFNQIYDLNLAMATQNNYLDVTLESTLKAYLSQFYRDLRPRIQKINFTGVSETQLDYIGYGSYALAPDCNGDIQVSMHLIGRDSTQKSYLGHGQPHIVMSQIASKIFEDFQRTQFPSVVKVGNKTLTLIGGMNGSVDVAASPEIAKQSCETLNARLPEANELELLNTYGDWSGGVSLGHSVWALPSGKVFAPTLRNPSPIRKKSEVNATKFNYYCVQN